MAAAVQTPHVSHRHHTFSSVTQTTTPRTTLHKQSSSYRTNSSSGMTSISSYSSASANYSYGGSSYDTQPQILHGKLHKRSHSKETAVSIPSPTQEEFFPTDPAQHKKGIIKPLLKKVQHTTGISGKLDLGKADGGAGGVFYTSSSPYIGSRSSATDLTSFVPTHRQQHKRTTSGNSASSNNSTPNYHPRRYAPTPTQSYPNSIGGSDASEDDDDFEFGTGKPSAPALKIPGASGSPLSLPPKIPVSESAPISPITPLGRSATMDSFDRKRKVVGGRNSSEEYAESVRAARAMFEKREREKEEKEERRARKSISKEDRRPSNDGASSSNPISKTRWNFTRHSTPELGTTEEKTIGIPYGSGQKTASTSRASLRGIVMRGAEDGRYSRMDREKRNGGGGFKNQWQGFVMWVRIGFVKVGRKVRNLF